MKIKYSVLVCFFCLFLFPSHGSDKDKLIENKTKFVNGIRYVFNLIEKDGVFYQHGLSYEENKKGVRITEGYGEYGVSVGFWVNRDENGSIISACYYDKNGVLMDCVEFKDGEMKKVTGDVKKIIKYPEKGEKGVGDK